MTDKVSNGQSSVNNMHKKIVTQVEVIIELYLLDEIIPNNF